MVIALGKNIDQHGQCIGVMKEGVLGIDDRMAGDGMADDYGHHPLLDKLHDFGEQPAVFNFIFIQPPHEVLPGMLGDLIGDRQHAEAVEGPRVQLQGALVVQFANDVFMNNLQGLLRIDEMVVKNFLQGDQCIVGLLLEDAVAVPGQGFIEVGGALFHETPDTRTLDLLIVGNHLAPALELPRHTFVLIDKEDHDVKNRLTEVTIKRSSGEFAAEGDHLVVKHLETFDLNFCAWKPVEHGAVGIFGLEQLAEEDINHLPVTNHCTASLDFFRFRTRQQLAHHKRRCGDIPQLHDKVRVGTLAGSGRTPQQDQFTRKSKVLAPQPRLQSLPDTVENKLRIFDFKVSGLSGLFQGVGHAGHPATMAGTKQAVPGVFLSFRPIRICWPFAPQKDISRGLMPDSSKPLTNKPISVVTGGAGFLGSHLTDRLLAEGHKVIAIDNFITGNDANIAHLAGNPDYRFLCHNVTDYIFLPGTIDYVWHFASPASPIDYLNFPIPTLKVGSLGTHNCLGLAKEKGAAFLLASTSECYGDPLIHPQNENYWGNVNPIGPRGVYDEAKRFAEAITMAYHRFHGLDTKIVRIFNTYGPRMRLEDGRVVPAFIGQALSGKPLTIFGDGSQTRSFCYVSDLIDGIFRLMMGDYHEPVNIGNPSEMTILEFAQEILRITEAASTIEHRPLPVDDPKVRQPDITRAKKLLGWEPKVEFDEGIRKTIDYFRPSFTA
jgi:dTDP-glucose 4,6-dehydratase